MKKTNNTKGFTLVELIIVIAIVAILAAVLIPTISGYIEKAHRGRDVELAGNMTRDVSLYATEYDVEIDELTGVDVRTILLFNNYDLAPRKDKWVFVYDKTTNQVVVKDINNDGTISLDSVPTNPIDPTHIGQNYYLISKGKSNIEKSVNLMVNLRTNDDYTNALNMAPDKYEDVIKTFNPEKTLFIDNAGGYTKATSSNRASIIVVLELTSSLPKLTSDIADKFALDYTKSYPNPQTVRTSQPDSQLKPLFSAAKDIDLRKIHKIDLPAFGIGNEEYGKNDGKNVIYKLELEKYLTESFKQTVTDEVIGTIKYFEGTTHKGYIVKRQITVSYFNEKGLFAQGSIIYAVLEKTS